MKTDRKQYTDRIRDIIISHGQNPDYPPRGVSSGIPPKGLRNWICEVDGHEDPDNSGVCIHCDVVFGEDVKCDECGGETYYDYTNSYYVCKQCKTTN